jgi:hypothetical protein
MISMPALAEILTANVALAVRRKKERVALGFSEKSPRPIAASHPVVSCVTLATVLRFDVSENIYSRKQVLISPGITAQEIIDCMRTGSVPFRSATLSQVHHEAVD